MPSSPLCSYVQIQFIHLSLPSTKITKTPQLSLFVSALDATIVSTAAPTISRDLHSAAGYTWIGGAYLLANAASGPIWAKLSDIWGRKPMVLAALAIFFASSAVCATAKSMRELIVGRAVQGMAGGGLILLVHVCIGDLFSLRQRSLLMVGSWLSIWGGFGLMRCSFRDLLSVYGRLRGGLDRCWVVCLRVWCRGDGAVCYIHPPLLYISTNSILQSTSTSPSPASPPFSSCSSSIFDTSTRLSSMVSKQSTGSASLRFSDSRL